MLSYSRKLAPQELCWSFRFRRNVLLWRREGGASGRTCWSFFSGVLQVFSCGSFEVGKLVHQGRMQVQKAVNIGPTWVPNWSQHGSKITSKIVYFWNTFSTPSGTSFFRFFGGFWVPTWIYVGPQDAKKSVVDLKTPICI